MEMQRKELYPEGRRQQILRKLMIHPGMCSQRVLGCVKPYWPFTREGCGAAIAPRGSPFSGQLPGQNVGAQRAAGAAGADQGTADEGHRGRQRGWIAPRGHSVRRIRSMEHWWALSISISFADLVLQYLMAIEIVNSVS